MNENFILEDLAIKFSVLKKLPQGCTLLALVNTFDMGDNERKAVVVVFIDPRGKDLRKAYYCIETGEYLGDAFL